MHRYRRSHDRHRLVVFSPLPPLRNGIADYTAELLPWVAIGLDACVVIDDHAPPPAPCKDYVVIRLAEYVARCEEFSETPHLYQLGNNVDHVYLLPWLIRRPGIVVLHDVSLHHLVDQATLRWGDLAAYGAMLEIEYGQHGRLLAAQLHRYGRARSTFYELPLTREFLARSRAVIVHSQYAADKVASQQPDLPIELVRHHVAPGALQARNDLSREAARAALGLADDTVYLVSLGFVTKAKQIDTVLRFVAKHRLGMPWLRYVIAGQDQPDDFDVRSLIVQSGLSDVVQITGYVDEPVFYQHVIAADIVVNLRYPSGGETSGTLIRALGAGACVVVNDIGPFAEYPDDVCPKVQMRPGEHEAEFERVMLSLIEAPKLRRRFGNRAAQHVRHFHSVLESARRYQHALRSHARRPVLPLPLESGAAYLPTERLESLLAGLQPADRVRLPLWASTGAVPLPGPGDETPVLLIGHEAHDRKRLQDLFGHDERKISHWPPGASPWALPGGPPRSHPLTLIELNANVSSATLAMWLTRINHRLLLHGHMLLTLRGPIATTLSALKAVVATTLERSGYSIELFTGHRERLSFALDSAEGWNAAEILADDPPQWLWRARKISEFISPRSGEVPSAGQVAG